MSQLWNFRVFSKGHTHLRRALLASAALSAVVVGSAMSFAQAPMGNAEVISGDAIDRSFGGSTAEPPRPVVPPRPPAEVGRAPWENGAPVGVAPPVASQAAPVQSPRPAGQVAAPVASGAQASPRHVQPVQPVQPSQARPVIPVPLGAGQVAPVSQGISTNDPTGRGRLPVQPRRLSFPPGSEVQPSTEIDVSEEEATRQLENLNRQRRILETQRQVETERLAIERALADRRKVLSEGQTPPPVDPPPPPPAAAAPSEGSVADAIERERLSDPTGQMAVLSIVGPSDRLVATVKINGFGNVMVRAGGVLPGNVRVVSLTGNGLTVRPLNGAARLLPFAN